MNQISDTAKIYRNVRLVDCVIKDNAVVADDCDLTNVTMESLSEFGIRNSVRDCKLGHGSYTGQNCVLRRVEIGKYCSISSSVNIWGGAGHNYLHTSSYTAYWLNRTFNAVSVQEGLLKTTKIGSDVWIGSGAVILDGLNIGDGAVIGAGAVVTKNVQPYSIVVGNPARELKKRFSQEYIDKLLKICWWNIPPEILSEHLYLLNSELNEKVLDELENLNKFPE